MWLSILLEIGFCGLLVGIDLFSKGVIMPFLTEQGGRYTLVDGVLEFRYAENHGASFGIFSGDTVFLLVLTILTAIILIGALVYLSDKPKFLRYGLLTILGGAIGNIMDRAVLGYVRDFIDYTFLETWFGIDFAIGNIADIFCLVGLLIVIVYIFFGYKENDLQSRFKRFQKCNKTA